MGVPGFANPWRGGRDRRAEADPGTERLHRLASKSIKVSELHTKEAKLQGLQDALKNLNSQIAAEKKKAEDEAGAQARERILREE